VLDSAIAHGLADAESGRTRDLEAVRADMRRGGRLSHSYPAWRSGLQDAAIPESLTSRGTGAEDTCK
jgi:hypothetical protein